MRRLPHGSVTGILAALFAAFLIIAALVAAAAAVTLFARGTPLSSIWDSKEPVYHELLRHRLIFGTGFTLLAVALSFAAVGWIAGRRWGWALSTVIIATNSLADLAQLAAARGLAGWWVIAIDAAVLGWLLSGPVRKRFANRRHRWPHPAAPGA
jgi:hypothetical protein